MRDSDWTVWDESHGCFVISEWGSVRIQLRSYPEARGRMDDLLILWDRRKNLTNAWPVSRVPLHIPAPWFYSDAL